MIKRIFFQIHWFLGITAGLILSLMGITGAIYSYEQQILKAINSESYVVEAQQQEKLNPTQLYQHFSQQDPDLKINSITIAKDATASSTVNIVKEGARRGYNMMVNPYTAEVLPEIKGQKFFAFIQDTHRYMLMKESITIFGIVIENPGKKLTGACVLMLIFFVLSGIYLRWPKKHSLRQWFAIKPKLKGRNFIWDLHAVVGTWVIVFYLIFAVTGLYWSYDWWRNGMFAVLGVERPQPQMQAGGQGGNPQGQGREGRQNREAGRQQQTTTEGQARGERPQGGEGHRGGDAEQQDKITPQQMEYALTATWVGFHQQLTRDYSSMTINLPKDTKEEVKLSFVDAIPQHERARNNATYDYQSNTITEMELYEDKKLNEKIMSSMLPVHRGSFMGPIYQFVAMLASLAMPLFFVTGWMLYLKRRKQKALTQNARLNSDIATDPNAEQWTIFYASQTGTAEQLAYNTATSLQQSGLKTDVKALKDLSFAELATTERALFIVSTYGTGDAPDLATSFVKKHMSQTGSLSQLKYAVLALGSKEYPETFCTFGHQLNQWLSTNQAQQAFPLIEVDNANKTDLEAWFTALAQITGQQVSAIITEKTFDDWTLTHRQLLNPNSLGEPAYEIVLTPQADTSWHAGDIAEIQAGNSTQRIQDFLMKHQLTATSELFDALRFKNLNTNVMPTSMSNTWIDLLDNLHTREYSIASIPTEGILRLVVRQAQSHGELGLGSGWLTAHVDLNTTLPLRIRHNPSFHLIDDNRPIILIGNGTGIAGLFSLLKQREQLNFDQNWLIFGERQQTVDYFYQTQLQNWLNNGVLSILDVVFSRDQAERRYVQHKLYEQQQQLREWVQNGAVIYVCGSIDGMASGVDQALNDILGEEAVQQLLATDRYRRDVY